MIEEPILYFHEGSMLTTIDNPYNPTQEWDKWDMWDKEHGYNTTSLLARLGSVPFDSEDLVVNIAIDRAMKEVIDLDVEEMYVVVLRP